MRKQELSRNLQFSTFSLHRSKSPTVHPTSGVVLGSSMQILCIAMGSPTPTITLYIDGHPIRSEKSRHMVTTIHDVARNMGNSLKKAIYMLGV